MRNRILMVLLILSLSSCVCSCARSDRKTNDFTGQSFTAADEMPASSSTVDAAFDGTTECILTSAVDETACSETSAEVFESTVDSETIKDLVVDAFAEDFVFDGMDFSYRIPRVQLDSDEIERANAELYETAWQLYGTWMEKREGYGPQILCSQYEWAVNGDVLSLHFWAVWYSSCGKYHIVKNYSISQRRVLSKEEVLQIAGWTLPDFEEKCREVLVTELINWPFPSHPQPGNTLEIRGMWYDAYINTLSDENIEKAVPFLNEKCHLCVLGHGYTLYEGGRDWFIIDLEEYEVSPFYRDDYQIGDTIEF